MNFFTNETRRDRKKDIEWLNSLHINEFNINQYVNNLKKSSSMDREHEIAWLLKAVTLIDLTTLAADDTPAVIKNLCIKACYPLPQSIIKGLSSNSKDEEWLKNITTAAVCVYPSRVEDAVNELKVIKNRDKKVIDLCVASVATGFPSGQYPLSTRLAEVQECVKYGAREVDVVLDRSLVLLGHWNELFSEVQSMEQACHPFHLKTILATGECGSLQNVANASLVAMIAGSHFIKTSTGKETVNATLEVGLVMCRAIKFFYNKTGRKVGLKPAGGLKTWQDALLWMLLVRDQLGPSWLDSKYFRIGASSLLNSILERLHWHACQSPIPVFH